ncbi:tetratricopeptide repeat protein [Caminibacter sp.]
MKKLFLLAPLLLFAEVNPFNVKIDTQNYNSLTPQEKQILKNKINLENLKKEINSFKKDLRNLQVKLVSYDETIEQLNQKTAAFNTILSEIDSLKATTNVLKKENNVTKSEIESIKQRLTSLENNVSNIKNDIKALKQTIKEMANIQNQNFIYLKQSIDTILNTIKNQNKKLSPKEAMSKAKKLFYSDKLNEAKEYFLYTLSKRYLPATSSFYLGEIAFKQGKYSEALGYYKKSVKFYPKKTSFTEKLLYHTAISFKKIGNNDAARITLEKLIKDYSNSKYAKLAKKELEKLK